MGQRVQIKRLDTNHKRRKKEKSKAMTFTK